MKQKEHYIGFSCFFWFVSFKSISLGFHLNLWPIHIEIHLPFGFIKIGFEKKYFQKAINEDRISWRKFGFG